MAVTITAVIASQTAAANSATIEVDAGAIGNFKAVGMVGDDAPIIFEALDSAAGFGPLSFIDEGGNRRTAALRRAENSLSIIGPAEFRIVKPITKNAVTVDQYT